MEEYKYPENIDVISGFGTGSEYEIDCRASLFSSKYFADLTLELTLAHGLQ